jgi:hypothetical protein
MDGWMDERVSGIQNCDSYKNTGQVKITKDYVTND